MKDFGARLISTLLAVALLALCCGAFAEGGFEALSKGSKGDSVAALQEKLNELGYSVGAADGDYGNKTADAVARFQADRGLPQTGAVDPDTYNAIFGTADAQAADVAAADPAEADLSSVTLSGEEVFVLEDALHTIGYLAEEADQDYDAATAGAVQCFQAACYKEITGIADGELIALAVQQAAEYNNYIRPFMSGMEYGYINTDGEVVIEPYWGPETGIGSGAGFFYDGLAKVWSGSKWGYIDATGETVIPAQWPVVYDFSQERAFVQDSSKKWGCIDAAGEQVIDFEYDDVARYAAHTSGDLSAAGYRNGYSFSDGLAAVCKDGRWGYVDLSGEVRIDLQFDSARVFHGGYAVVERDGQAALIDTEGNAVIPFGAYSRIGDYMCSRLVVLQGEDWGVIDIDRNVIVPFGTYLRIGTFSEGKASVLLGEGQYGYITATGEQLNAVSPQIDVQYSGREDFRDVQYHSGIATLTTNTPEGYGYAFIDIHGDVVAASGAWPRAGSFDCGLAEVWEAKGKLAFYKTDGSKLTSFTTGKPQKSSGGGGSQSDFEQIALSYLKSRLKNPASLQVHSTSSYMSGGSCVVSIDYSAMNGFGGYNRETFYCMIDGNGNIQAAYSH